MAPNPNNKKRDGKGCLILIIGTLLVVLGAFLFMPLAGKLTSVMVNSTLEGQVGYVMLTAAESCIAAVLLFLFAILAIHYFDMDDKGKEKRPTPNEKQYKFLGTRAATWVITGALMLCVVGAAFVYATTYRSVTMEGISTTYCHFITTNEYEWKQVSSYKVDCDEDKGLSVTLTMRDGKKFEILQSSISAPRAFHEQYDCKEAFVADLLEMLEEKYQITPNVSHIERTRAFYQNDETLWPHVKRIIGYNELVPEGDEAPETSSDTVAETEGVTES